MFSDSNPEKNTESISDYTKYKNDRKRTKIIYFIALCIVYLGILLILLIVYSFYQITLLPTLSIFLISLGCYIFLIIAILITN